MTPFDQEVQFTSHQLQNQKLVLYPTDTVWGIGCMATSEAAVKKIYQLKQRNESKALICLVSSITMLKQYIKNVPDNVVEILKNTKKPTTVIYNSPIRVAKNLIATDNTLAVRVVNDDFCVALINAIGAPLVSTSANISGEVTPHCFKEIDNAIVNGVDYVVNLHRNKINTSPSKIIKILNNGDVEYIRK